ncbi:restriction endonuclease subunit S [Streptomyces sp. NPDC048669]|uniref:restriction endonuclease subunit S n=1 Tax=Streptomyces sp. NPDC048669 TaxID=3155267 RepID=UPI003439E8A2
MKHLCRDSGQYGLNVSADMYTTSGTRLIRTSDIAADGSLKAAGAGVYIDGSLEPRHQLRQGDILLSRSGTLGRSFLVSEKSDGQTFAGFLIRFRPTDRVDPRFLHYATQSKTFQGIVHSEAVSSTIQNFNAERYANIPMRAPTHSEQQRIADFLDAETARIDRLSVLRSEQLTLIRESLITESAHLSGRTMVNSAHGLKEHVVQLRRATSAVQTGITPADLRASVDDVAHDDLPWYTPAAIDEWMSIAKAEKVTRGGSGIPIFPSGSVIVTGIGESLGKVGYLPHAATGNQQLTSLSPSSGVNGRFIAWQLRAAEKELREWAQYSRIRIINNDTLKSFPIYLPPRTKQDSAVRILDSGLSQVQKAEAAISRFQRVANERRQALITAAVTGQFDVSTASGRNVSDGVHA